jgi:hypothetical protein
MVVTNFQFRLNGIIISQMFVRPVVIGETTDHWELAACDAKLGEFAIDDNEDLVDSAAPPIHSRSMRCFDPANGAQMPFEPGVEADDHGRMPRITGIGWHHQYRVRNFSVSRHP